MSESSAQRGGRLFPLHLTPFETYMFWDDRPEYPSTIAVEWTFSGRVDRAGLATAMDFALARHPLLRAIIRPAKLNRDCWVNADDVRSEIHWGGLREPIELPEGEAIDLRRQPGLRVWGRHDDRRLVLTTQFHHASCDGAGFYQFFGDLLWHYSRQCGATLEDLPPLPLESLRRRLRAGYKVEEFLDAEGKLRPEFHERSRHVLQACAPLSPAGQGVSGPVDFPGVLLDGLNPREYREMKAKALERGQMANDVLIERLFLAIAAWNEMHRQPGDESMCILVPLDLRETDTRDISAANIVTHAFVRRSTDEIRDRKALIDGLREEMVLVKQERHRSAFMGKISSLFGLSDELRTVINGDICVASAILSNSGDPTRRFHVALPRENGLVRCGSLLLEGISGVPPLRPHTRASLSVLTYGRALQILVRCDPRFFRPDDTRKFLDLYLRLIRETTGECVP